MYRLTPNPWLPFFAWKTDQTPDTTVTAATAGLALKIERMGLASVDIPSFSAATGPTDWAAGKLWPSSAADGGYRIGISTASISGITGMVCIAGTYTGGKIRGPWIEISAYDPATNPLSSLGANAPAGWINSAAIATGALSAAKFGTDFFLAVATAVDAGLLDAGDATDLIAGIVSRIGNTNVDETVFVTALKAALFDGSSIGNKLTVNASGQIEASNMRGTDGAMLADNYTAPLSPLQTQSAAAAALDDYDPPTRAESTADKEELIAVLPDVTTGPHHVQITIVDDVTDEPVELAEVRMKRPGESGSDTTGDDGVAEFACSAAAWKVLVRVAGYEGAVRTVEVEGDMEEEIRLTPIEVELNEDPELCSFRIRFVRVDGSPIVGAAVRAVLARERQCVNGGVVTRFDVVAEDPLTDADGVVTLLLVQGVQVYFTLDGVAESVRSIVAVPLEMNAVMTCQR